MDGAHRPCRENALPKSNEYCIGNMVSHGRPSRSWPCMAWSCGMPLISIVRIYHSSILPVDSIATTVKRDSRTPGPRSCIFSSRRTLPKHSWAEHSWPASFPNMSFPFYHTRRTINKINLPTRSAAVLRGHVVYDGCSGAVVPGHPSASVASRDNAPKHPRKAILGHWPPCSMILLEIHNYWILYHRILWRH